MTTGYTREQLRQLTEIFNSNVPIKFGNVENNVCEPAIDFAIASDTSGILLRLTFNYGICKDFHLNCLAARELLTDLGVISDRQGWLVTEPAAPFGSSAPVPTMRDGDSATKATSLRIEPHSRGVRLFFGSGEEVFQFLMNRSIAGQLRSSIQQAGDIALWWDDKMDLQPLPDQTRQRLKKDRKPGARTRRITGAAFWGDYRAYVAKS